MFSRFIVKNFKSIGEPGIDLALKPLTLLVGPNGAGKSSILEAMAILPVNVGQQEFRLGGELVQFAAYEQIAHKHELARWMTWEIHLPEAGIRYEHRPDTGEERETVILADDVEAVQYNLRGDRRKGFSLTISFDKYKDVNVGNTLIKFDSRRYEWEELGIREKIKGILGVPQHTSLPGLPKVASFAEKIATYLKDGLFLLSSLRGDVPSQAGTQQMPDWVGVRGQGLIPLLSLIQSSPTYEGVWNRIQHWAAEFGLLRLKAGLRGANMLASDFVDPELKSPINLASAGHGSRQILSVITQLFWAKPGSIILIEEPELSLHPEAQVRLGELFAEAIKEDKQIIATTHSHFLLLALSRAVKKGLKVDDIAVYEIRKDQEGTKAKPVKLSKRGYPLGWPPSYEKVERDIALSWSKGLSQE